MRSYKLFLLLSLLSIFLNVILISQEDDVYLRVEGILQSKELTQRYKFYLPAHWSIITFEKKFEFPEYNIVEEKEHIEVNIKELFVRGAVVFKLQKRFEFQQWLISELPNTPVKYYVREFKKPEISMRKRFSTYCFHEHQIELRNLEYEDKLSLISSITILRKSLNFYETSKHVIDLSIESPSVMTKIVPQIQKIKLKKNFRVLNSLGMLFTQKETSGFISMKNFGLSFSESNFIPKDMNSFTLMPYTLYSIHRTETVVSAMLLNPSVNFVTSVNSDDIGYTNLSFPIQILNIRGDLGFSLNVSNGSFGMFPLFDFGFSNPDSFLGLKGYFENEGYKLKLFGIYRDLKIFGYVGYSTLEMLPTFGSGVSYTLRYLTPYFGFEGNMKEAQMDLGLTTGPFNLGPVNILSNAFVQTDGTVKKTDMRISLEVGSIVRNVMINLKGFLALEKGELNYGGGISIQF
ncbi:MAG TPA: hypothetical protein ENF81_02325 [Thermotogaceae bacterium]|nr:hypothetical protein [Thermotogaceae bacterium]